MLSGFFKKLLFARQFYMMEGRIEILNEKHGMLPIEVLAILQENLSDKNYASLQNRIKDYTRDFTGRLGTFEAEMLDALVTLYETFGLGKMEVMNIDAAKKKAIVCVSNNPLIQKSDKAKSITAAIIAGMFSCLFKKEVECSVTQLDVRSGFCEFMVK